MRGHVQDYCGDCGLVTPSLSHSPLRCQQSKFRPVKYIQYFIQHKFKCYAQMFPVHHLLLMPSELHNACLYTVMTSSNGMSGCIGRSHSPAHLAIMLNCLVAHCTARSMDPLVRSFHLFSFAALQRSCRESIVFNGIGQDYFFLAIIEYVSH